MYFMEIVELTKMLGIVIDVQQLDAKQDACSYEKDVLYMKKQEKLGQIYEEIKGYEYKIKLKQNQMENVLRPQLTVAMTSLLETEDKMAKVESAKSIFEKKIAQTQSELEKQQEQEILFRLRNDKQSQIRHAKSTIEKL